MLEEIENELSEELKQALKKAVVYFVRKSGEEKYGDVTVTMSLHEGKPFKITTSYSDHLVQRKTEKITVNKESGKRRF